MQAGAGAAIVEGVQDFGRHDEVRTLQPADMIGVAGVMFCIHSAERVPRVQHRPLLWIVKGKLAVEIAVPATLIAVVPDDDARVVHIALYQFAHEQPADDGAMGGLPSAQFVEHIEAELVAGFEKSLIGRIVRHADGVHIHGAQQSHIFVAILAVQRTPGLRAETVAVHALQQNALTIDVESLAFADFKSAKTKTGRRSVHSGIAAPTGDLQSVEVRRFGVPEKRIGRVRAQAQPTGAAGGNFRREWCAERFLVGVEDLGLERLGHEGGALRPDSVAQRAECDVGCECTVGSRVDGDVVDGLGRHGFEPDGTVNAAEHPVIPATLGAFGFGVGGNLAHFDVEHVVAVELDEAGDIIAKLREAALMDGAGGAVVHFDRGVGHHPVETEADAAALPGGGHGEAHAIETAFIAFFDLHLTIIVGAEAL